MGPIFLLAGGGRTGSTLVQRLLLSTRQVLMWGEHAGVLVPHLEQIVARMNLFLERHGNADQARFLAEAPNAWVATMNPGLPVFQAACRDFLDRALGASARELGYPRWGFKETGYGQAAARFLQELYPDASFVLLVRNPADCLRSVKSTSWYRGAYGANPFQFLWSWARWSAELARVQPHLPRSLLLHYEAVVARPAEAVTQIASLCHIAEPLFDLGLFQHRVRGTDQPPAALDEDDRDALQDGTVRHTADLLGYVIPEM